MKNWFANLTMMAFASFLLAACGGDSGTTNSAPKISDADYEADSYKGLPKCSDELDGKTAYVVDQEQGYVCKKGKWVEDDAAVEMIGSSSSSKKDKSSSSFKPVIDTVKTVDPETGDTIITLDTLAGIDSTLRKCAPEFDDKYMTYNGKTYRCYDDFWRPEKDPPKDTDAQVICLKTTDSNAPLKCYLDTAIWSSSSYVADPEDFVDQGVIKIKDGAITGVAQKGPYLQGSTYRIIPLDGKTLKPTGDTLSDQFNNSKGTYTFCDLNLPSQYAMIEASGYYRSELTGGKSNLQMTIGAIVDVQKGANINMITNLEYERVKYLVQNEGYNIAGAKKRALTEVLSAFHIENVTGSAEQLDITQDGEANGALLAISIMIQGVAGTEFNVIDMMKDFREDLKEDGQWTGKTARTVIADFAYEADSAGKLGGYRNNVASWGLGSVPAFESYIREFWGLEYGIGRCTEERYGEIKRNQNSASKHKDDYFICENGWRYIGEFEYNTKNNVCDVKGLIIPGNIDKDKYYICDNGWRAATSVEVDMYFTDCTQDGKLHRFSDGNLYKCSYDKFVKADPLDTALAAACVSYSEGKTFARKDDIHKYTCKNGSWDISWAMENCSEDGKIAAMYYEASDKKKGYVCDADTFRVASAADSLYDFACVSYTDGKTAERKEAIHTYTCENNSWKMNNKWSKSNCAKDGSIRNLIYDEKGSKKNYVCDADTFRVATKQDSADVVDIGKICVSYMDGEKIDIGKYEHCFCGENKWTCRFDVIYDSSKETLLDGRNGVVYRTVTIENQTWMAENLNLDYIVNGKIYGTFIDSDSGNTYGRYYTWAAAVDSAGVFSLNGKGCGYGKICSLTLPVQGVCPEGWHVPTTGEWSALYFAMGESPYAMQAKGYAKWSKATDSLAFSVLPDVGGYAYFWSATAETHDGNYAYYWYIQANNAGISFYLNDRHYKNEGFSVRCIKD